MITPINEEVVEMLISVVFNEQRTATNRSENKEAGTQEKITKSLNFPAKIEVHRSEKKLHL